MSRLRLEPRLTPPWPPGLESLKKAFLGSRRHRQLPPAGSLWTMYDDSLIVALALNRALKSPEGVIEPYVNDVTGLHVKASLQVDTSPDTAKAFIQRLVNIEPYDSEELLVASNWAVSIQAEVDQIRFDERSPMLELRGSKTRMRASWLTAIKTLNPSQRR